ncbi:FAD-dependent oxidoreductase [Haloarcula nitratireducens]|uniref:FAD-dependent oxidoreductase n=1 Tax=Haloarcula nitratireducens TaxID=2487749 RepID=A0AAW4PB34_9EURY|nr:FAD-dependent oxidoreductase [Halomicroarcula nitratireducens]MBX0294963.1 FAD-dependent oxidoreductase [Halomicroarcula nitratireducens]
MERNDIDSDGSPEKASTSIWLDGSSPTTYDQLDRDLSVDTVVVGGGIAGVTTAARLKEAGQSVAVVERDRILTGTTGHTTAKLTSLHGLRYDHLLEHFGEAEARQYAEANQAAIDEVEATIEARDIDCEFERTPAYTYATSRDGRGDVRDEVDAARRVGLPATYTESTPLPYDVEAAVRFDEQARFDPRKYLLALARDIPGDGSYVFEDTKALDVDDGDPCRVQTEYGDLTADDVVMATNFPFVDRALYFSRLYPKRSYVVAARVRDDPVEGMYYHSEEPYFSVRPRPGGDESMVLVGGQNHQTGQGGSTEERYRALERQARERFDVESIEYRWSTQDYTAVDEVPFVGPHTPRSDHVYVATGFGGWGLTNGVAAGRLLSELVLGREPSWRDVYDPNRLQVGASMRAFLHYNADSMRHFVGDRLEPSPAEKVGSLGRGEGTVVRDGATPVGVSRDADGELHAVSARCTHLGCLVEWNDGERSWDCPCHGSRFDCDGDVLDSPAVEELDAVDLDDVSVSDDESAT